MLIDASALASYILREKGSERVRECLVQGVMSPELVVKETANAIVKAERAGRIDDQQAHSCLRALKALSRTNIRFANQEDVMEESFDLALKSDLTVYDALYISLAKKLKVPLLTCDERQAKAAGGEGIEVTVL